MLPFSPTMLRAGGGNLAGFDADLARQMEEMWTLYGGNRMAYSYAGARVSSYAEAPSWDTAASEFRYDTAGFAVEYQLPWEIAVGFNRVEATLVIARHRKSGTLPKISMRTDNLVVAGHGTQTGTAVELQGSTPSEVAGTALTRTLPPYWLLRGIGVDSQEFVLWTVNCGVVLSAFAADRRMKITFDSDVNDTLFIVSAFVRDVSAPTKS